MYKKINHFGGKSFGFIPAIQNIINSLVDKYMNEFEYSLFQNLRLADPSEKISRQKQILDRYVASVLNESTTTWELNFSYSQKIELLDALLTDKMESLMVVDKPITQFGEATQNKKCEKVELCFKDYIENHNGEICAQYLNSFTNKYVKISDTQYVDRPLYFLLYRLRNNILHTINERNYSVKAMESLIKKIRDQFEIMLYRQAIQENLTQLSSQDLRDIFLGIEKEMLDDYLMQYRLGKTAEEGNKLAHEVREKLDLADVQGKVREETETLFLSLFTEYNEGDLKVWFTKYIELFNDYATQVDALLEKRIPFYVAERFIEHLRIRMVGKLMNLLGESKVFSIAYSNIDPIHKGALISKICGEFFNSAEYVVYFNIDDLISSEQIKEIDFDGITILSDQAFVKRQAEWYNEPNSGIIISGESSKVVWISINVTAGFDDVEMAVNLGLRRLKQFLNILYHFISREDEINYKIRSQCIIFNHTRQSSTLKHLTTRPWQEPKDIDIINKDLINFIVKQLNIKSIWRSNMSEAVAIYTQLLKSEDIHEKIVLIRNLLEILFQDLDAALFSSIIIAGSNIDKASAKYGDLRYWLYEDYQELMYLADKSREYSALKERIFERFKVFSRMILRTLWFNLNEISEDGYNTSDVAAWILFLHPDNEIVGGGVRDE